MGVIDAIDQINRKTYRDKKISAGYTRSAGLQAPEVTILNQIGPSVCGKKILDVGVGAGRTLPFLKEISNAYIGIDYSKEMIDVCRANHPGADLRVGDARKLSDFSDGQFDLVFFSFNGLDYVPHNDRLVILSEMNRVLAKGGYYVFSSHNKRCLYSKNDRKAVLNPFKPFATLKYLVRSFIGGYNHLRNKKHEVHTDTYSIVNDSGHHYRLLTYYITLEQQIYQLRAAGFNGPVTAYDLEGKVAPQDDVSPWLYYCVQKI